MTQGCSPKVTHQTGINWAHGDAASSAGQPRQLLVLMDTKHLHAFGADDIDSGISCPRARRVLQVDQSIRAQVCHSSRAPKFLSDSERL